MIPNDVYVNTWKDPIQKLYLANIPGGVVPDDGYIIICKNEGTFTSTYNKACDIEDGPIQPDGLYSAALMDDTGILDIYGRVGRMLPSVLIFKDGRAFRDLNAPTSSNYCVPKHWHIVPGNILGSPNAVTTDMDPRDWKANALKLFFTEFADPSNNSNHRFIELYSPNFRNYNMVENLFIFRHNPGNNEKFGLPLALNGLKINGNGFAVLCVTNWSNECTYVAGFNSIIFIPGIFAYTLQKCDNGPNRDCEIIDSYGVGCFSDGHSYENGRAIRKKSAFPRPTDDFDLDHWVIIKPSYDSKTDPGEWNAIAAPSSPSKGSPSRPSPSRPSPSKNKRRSRF